MSRWRPAISDPGLFGLRNAARAALVMPAVFAFAHFVVDDPQTTLFAAFGSFAVLVFADFGGTPRQRLEAYGALALAGTVLIALGTLCSRTTWAATAAMAAIGFAILFAGIVNGWLAAGATAALLTFVLPVSLPADVAEIAPRLLGWGIACLAGTAAQLVLWPRRPRDALRDQLADAARALAAQVAAPTPEREAAAATAVRELERRFLSTPYRPAGPTATAAALAYLVDELAWLAALDAQPLPGAGAPDASADDRALLGAAARTLHTAADALDEPHRASRRRALHDGLAALDAARDELTKRLPERSQAAAAAGETALQQTVAEAFRHTAVARAAADVGRAALVAAGESPPRLAEAGRAAERLAADHASARSVWFRNSVRGAVALALAVLVAHETGVQEGFWVVLGTLSVLRSNALGTGATIVGALVGTALGIVAGAAIVLAIGTSGPALWACLPPAVLLAAYAPRAISFPAGQAGFTVLLLVLFNLLRPVGWEVGLVRIEDVALGFSVSLLVGLLLWPRGAGALLRATLGDAYARGADHVRAGLHALTAPAGAADGALAAAERAAEGSGRRLDDALRQYLSERGGDHAGPADVAALAAGAASVRRTARSLAALVPDGDDSPLLEQGARALSDDVRAVHDWYEGLGRALAAGEDAPALPARDGSAQEHVLRCASQAVAARDTGATAAAFALLWASLHLDDLRRLERRLRAPAEAFAR
ncbi:FUSC family protein [Conexibacter arvalis]|uniref:Putative membrane protein YccC n=1 Tax=Conexibacter arvalis TaxID=912552 RepID=A0A840I9Y6_9ACTN|nr:FUSC family protein [Conexibacter arvalis]MBB4660740.1 putative membrane protein YccC [Conexibacter arvalis]